MNISLIGLGAIGASYAALLNVCSQVKLTVILDAHRLKSYADQPFTVNGVVQNFHYLSADAKTEPADLVLVAVKYNALPDAIANLKHHVGENTVIMSLLNGIDSEEILGAAFGMDKMLYSLCIGIDAQRADRTVSYGSVGKILFNEKNGECSPRVQKIAETFTAAGVPFENPIDMYKQLWYKFMINVCANQTTAILGANYRHINTPDGHTIMEMVADEVRSVAAKKGVSLTDDDYKSWLNILNTMIPENKTSMHQDMDACRRTEVDMLAGVIRKIGSELGVPTPHNDMLYHMIKLKEQMNALKNR